MHVKQITFRTLENEGNLKEEPWPSVKIWLFQKYANKNENKEKGNIKIQKREKKSLLGLLTSPIGPRLLRDPLLLYRWSFQWQSEKVLNNGESL